ncbi:hypothetical protein GDO81_001920 [Engystomops pustulosus]|nr:hypothetical protein GDO81_001920 [Engystomops pustulosus]
MDLEILGCRRLNLPFSLRSGYRWVGCLSTLLNFAGQDNMNSHCVAFRLVSTAS